MDDAQDATQTTPPAPPTQSQGAANAAAHASVTQRDLWNRLDTDKDGMISATEADADADFDGRFAAMDSDGDGSISDAEYTTYAKTNLATSGEHAADHSQAAMTSVWSNFDQDDDGKLSATEVEADANLKVSFADMDGDDDGFVTQDEYRDYAMVNRKPAEPESP
jgi:Ca2+-binding EF-hand superfamily protein